MRLNSIRFKISVLYVVILGIVLIFYSTFLYFSLHYTLYDELDNELNIKARETASTLDSYMDDFEEGQTEFLSAAKRIINLEDFPDPDQIDRLQRQWLQKVDKLNLKEDYINLLDAKGISLVRSNNLQKGLFVLSAKEIKKLQEKTPVFRNIKFDKRNLRIINVPFSYRPEELYVIQIGTSLKPIIHLLQIRLLHILVSIPIVLLTASLFGRIFAVRILRPVVEVTRTANKITHEDLSARVKAEHVDEEMKYLVAAFNNMISRLEQSFKYIVEFSSQVAHELKTPLAIIKGESDVALRKPRGTEEYKRVIRVTLEESERMHKVIEDLLLLAKLEYRPEYFEFERLELNEFLAQIYEQSRILAAAKDIAVIINTPAAKMFINADKLHLRRLFFNLISNSVKFTDQKGKIDITVRQEDNKAVISIADTGIGITGQDLPRIFDRFFHIDRTGKISEPSLGLGLSIAKSIVDLHYGHIDAKSIPGQGSIFTVTLPLA